MRGSSLALALRELGDEPKVGLRRLTVGDYRKGGVVPTAWSLSSFAFVTYIEPKSMEQKASVLENQSQYQ